MTRRSDLDDALPDIIEEYDSGASAAFLSRKYSANIWSILSRLRKAGIYIRSNKEQNEKRLDLDENQREKFVSIVDGLLLGDGRIGNKGILRLEQSKIRLGWLDHVARNLASIGVASRIIPTKARDRYIDGRKVHFKGGGLVYTPCYVECQEQRDRWYPEGTKIVPKDLTLNPLSVAYWLSGDGSCAYDGTLRFYTNSFSEHETERLAEGLTQIGVEARCVSTSRPNEWNVIITKKESAYRLKELIEPHVPECCVYKLRYVRLKSGNRPGVLSFEQAEEIRRRHQKGEGQSQMAREYGVTSQTIGNIVRGRTYKRKPKIEERS